ncbi:MAG: hypothetical protein KIT11_07070 [Fimbriimonadaceae bacterium]|nr:hypothetical protein [Fimbriimonadaceae bacterium]QYK56112.1 MAG: hypothetical protein KF733_01260 [Fimbriimonadaceae bacterium]
MAFTGGSLSADVNVPAGYCAAGYRFVNTATGQATDMVPIGLRTVALSLELGGDQPRETTQGRKKAA